MTVNFDSSSLFSFSVDSCCADDAADNDEVAAAAASTAILRSSKMLPHDSRLSYLTVMSEQISSSPNVSRCKALINSKLERPINNNSSTEQPNSSENNHKTRTSTKPRTRIHGGDSISLSGATLTRPQTSTMVDRRRMKRSLSAKLSIVRPLDEIKPSLLDNEQEQKAATAEVDEKENNTTMKEVDQNNNSNKTSVISITNVTVDTSKAKSNSDVIRMCLAELGWHECAKAGVAFGSCDIVWQSCTTSHEGRDSVNTTPASLAGAFVSSSSGSLTRINKFPCMNLLLRKGPLTQSLNTMRILFESEYDFYPRTWFLPEHLKEFADECKYLHERQAKANKPRTIFIVKPNDGSQGDGIYLINSVDDYLKKSAAMSTKTTTTTLSKSNHFNQQKKHIVQEYIHNPYLIDGLKSDLRIYVVILSLKPLQIYIYDEGLVRFATVDYQAPNEKNIDQIFMHLTNYSLNKKNESYKFTPPSKTVVNEKENRSLDDESSQNKGSKRKLSKIFELMAKKGINVNKIKSRIDDLVVKTVIALVPEMKVEAAFEAVNCPNRLRASCFQIIGFDILIREDFKPLLLEVNCNPSLRIDYEIESSNGRIVTVLSPIDLEIKKPLVLETLKLVAPPKKLEIMQKLKRDEQQKLKEVKLREQLVKQRIEQRLQSAKKIRILDMEKCPLLSKPGEMYMKNKQIVKQKQQQLQLGGAADKSLLDSSSLTSNSWTSTTTKNAMSSFNNFESRSILSLNSQHTTGNSSTNRSKPLLRLIYPSSSYHQSSKSSSKFSSSYDRLKVVEHVADIFMCFTLFARSKFISHFGFRSFIKQCNLIGEKLSADNLDVIFFDLNKKWEFYNRKKSEPKGLCFQGFVECFFKLARLIFDDVPSNVESVKNLIYYCKFCLKLKGVKPNQFFDMDLANDSSSSMTAFKVSVKLATLMEAAHVEVVSKNTNRTLSALSTTANNNISSPIANSNLDKYKQLDEKKSVFPIFF